jgi:hypothetical protein
MRREVEPRQRTRQRHIDSREHTSEDGHQQHRDDDAGPGGVPDAAWPDAAERQN